MFEEDADSGATRLPFKFLQQRQQREKTRWLNSPNSYTKVSVEGGEERYNSRTTTVSSVAWKVGVYIPTATVDCCVLAGLASQC